VLLIHSAILAERAFWCIFRHLLTFYSFFHWHNDTLVIFYSTCYCLSSEVRCIEQNVKITCVSVCVCVCVCARTGIWGRISCKRLEIEPRSQWATNRKWHMPHWMVTWSITTLKGQGGDSNMCVAMVSTMAGNADSVKGAHTRNCTWSITWSCDWWHHVHPERSKSCPRYIWMQIFLEYCYR